ncbi:MAG: hypothetical protein ACRC8S_21650 [Fimbriiglobus sp.]
MSKCPAVLSCPKQSRYRRNSAANAGPNPAICSSVMGIPPDDLSYRLSPNPRCSATLTEVAAALREIDDPAAESRSTLAAIVFEFFAAGPSPSSVFDFETRIADAARELGRRVVERVYNRLEGEAATLPAKIRVDGEDYRRLNEKTPHRHVATLLGTVTLWRHGYRPSHRASAEATVFPLEESLGLVGGATPALAEAAGRYLAEGGATQRTALDRSAPRGQLGGRAVEERHGRGGAVDGLGPPRIAGRTGGRPAATSRCQPRFDQAGAQRRPRRHHAARVPVPLLRSRRRRHGDGLRPGRDETRERLLGGGAGAQSTGDEPAVDGVDRRRAEGVGRADATLGLRHRRGRQRDGVLPPRAAADAAPTHQKEARLGARRRLLPRLPTPVGDGVGAVRNRHAGRRRVGSAHGEAAEETERPVPRTALGGATESAADAAEVACEGVPDGLQLHPRAEPVHAVLRIRAGEDPARQRLKLSGMRWTKAGAEVILDLRVMLLSGLWTKGYRMVLNGRSDRICRETMEIAA